MKKIVLLGIAATALLTACSNDDVVEVKTTSPIGFNTFVENSTRADLVGEVNTDNITEFGVWGFTTPSGDKATQIFNAEKVSKGSDNNWTYANTQYWVAGNDYAFAALSPIPSSSNNISYSLGESPSAPTGTVTFTQDAIAERDLVYAYKAITSAAVNASNTWDAVAFTFDHLLSRVAVKVTNSSDNAQNTAIRISNIKLVGPAIKGTFATSSDISSTTWTIDGDAGYVGDQDKTPSAIEIGATTAGTKVYFPAEAGTDIVTINANKSEYGVARGKAAQAQWAYIIPLGSSSTQTYTITFDVEVYQAVSNPAGTDGATYQRYPQNSKSVYTVSFTTTAAQAQMVKGYSYVYGVNLKIDENLKDPDGNPVLSPIEFTLSSDGVNAFQTTTDIDVTNATIKTTTTE
jgi:hypothetical protein